MRLSRVLPQHLDISESTDKIPRALRRRVLATLYQNDWRLYPTNDPYEILDRIGNMFGVDSNRVVIFSGADGLINALAQVARDRDEVFAYPAHSYPGYRLAAQRSGVRQLAFDPREVHDPHDLAQAISCASLGVLGAPGNPVGGVTSVIPRDVPSTIVLDSTYLSLADPKLGKAIHSGASVVTSLSKSVGLAAARVGIFFGANAQVAADVREKQPLYPYDIMQLAVLEAVIQDGTLRQLKRIHLRRVRRMSQIRTLAARGGLSVLSATEGFVTISTEVGSATERLRTLVKGEALRHKTFVDLEAVRLPNSIETLRLMRLLVNRM